MDKLKLDNYVNLKQGIKGILDEFKDVTDYSKYTKKIIDLLENNSYEFVESAVCLYNYINEGYEKGSIDFNKLEVLLEELYYDLLLKYDIKLYFIGENNISLLTDKYLKIPVSNLKNINFNKNNIYNILIVEDKNINYDKEKFDKVYDYNIILKTLDYVSKDIFDNTTYKYDFYYLKNEIIKCRKEIFDTIIVGISYTVHGIDMNILKEKSNALYMSSQDLYYSYKMARQGILFNRKIKKCIIGMAYYYFNFDLSLSENLKTHIHYLYRLLLNDLHNINYNYDDIKKYNKIQYRNILKNTITDNIIHELFNFLNIQEDLLELFYKRMNGYYNDEFNKINEYMFNGKTFNEIDIDEKMKHTKYYIDLHNKKIKYKKTREENIKIFREFLEFLEKNNVEPVVVVFPHSKYYNENLNPEYKKDLYNIMDKMKKDYKFKFIDLNEYGEFDDTDFLDTDHLNPKGCKKATGYLNELIYE